MPVVLGSMVVFNSIVSATSDSIGTNKFECIFHRERNEKNNCFKTVVVKIHAIKKLLPKTVSERFPYNVTGWPNSHNWMAISKHWMASWPSS